MKRTTTVITVAALAAITLAGCSGSVGQDKAIAANQLEQYQQSQPVPSFPWSQERATLIALTQARATTTATTSFMYARGSADDGPVASCPSIGFPIASTAQLTNPLQKLDNVDSVVAQIEQTGIYTGESSGTYVVCVNDAGIKYPVYWEGDVLTVGGQAKFEGGQVVLVGKPTVTVEGSK